MRDFIKQIDRFMWDPIAYISGNLPQSYWNRELIQHRLRKEREALNHPFYSFPWF